MVTPTKHLHGGQKAVDCKSWDLLAISGMPNDLLHYSNSNLTCMANEGLESPMQDNAWAAPFILIYGLLHKTVVAGQVFNRQNAASKSPCVCVVHVHHEGQDVCLLFDLN